MASPRRSLTRSGRRLLGGLAAVVGVALLVVDAGYAPAAQKPTGRVALPPRPPVEIITELSEAEGRDAAAGEAGDVAPLDHGPHAPAQVPATHVVQPGETAGEIAEQYGVPASALVRANAHTRPETLQPGDLLVVPEPQGLQPLTPAEAAAADLEVEQVLDETARRYGWNPATVKAIAWYESRWNQRLVSDQEAIGVMQVQPGTGELMARVVGRPLDLHDLRDNVEAGVAYLDQLHDRYGGDLRVVIAAYHQGPEALRSRGIYRVSDVYTDEVLRLRAIFAG